MDITKWYGSKVFNDTVMRQRLPQGAYESLKKTQRLGLPLEESVADVVAEVMKNWAIEQGATHFTHWFQPMTDFTAGKHDAFLSPTGDGRVIVEFSSKALVRGEPDASSFPSGGLRATFEARGYTMWDPTSPAFVRDGTLYIPTAFCAYTGEALDTKTPLLRSMEALNRQGVRLLHAMGRLDVTRVSPSVGAEQEYFLIDREKFENRLDLKLCGRTLLGARPPKAQELEDHYCGHIRLRVSSFMKELDEELWALGIPSKTKHNETAPAQHEMAPVFGTANIACDNNQLTMEVMRVVAKRHGLACLLHEKPFAGINGSGKHNNYSLVTDGGENLLDPGKDPASNLSFQLFLAAMVEAVDRYGDLLRLSASSAHNDQRLGGFEAPPPIISIFLGEPLCQILRDAAGGAKTEHAAHYLETGVAALPDLLKDDSDRNRTSPFAFTGNKFEFRMVGSSQSIAFPNVVLNTALAQCFEEFAARLEQAQDREAEMRAIIGDAMKSHSRILFNGNNYSQEWVKEAQRRGLPVLKTSLEAFEAFVAPKNVELFARHGVFTPVECQSRYEVLVENFQKIIRIEASVMLKMASQQILPALSRFAGEMAAAYNQMATAGAANPALKQEVEKLSQAILRISECCRVLAASSEHSDAIQDPHQRAHYMQDAVRRDMDLLRQACDSAETLCEDTSWPMPTYTDLLYRV